MLLEINNPPEFIDVNTQLLRDIKRIPMKFLVERGGGKRLQN
jgi:hypothetical protein